MIDRGQKTEDRGRRTQDRGQNEDDREQMGRTDGEEEVAMEKIGIE